MMKKEVAVIVTPFNVATFSSSSSSSFSSIDLTQEMLDKESRKKSLCKKPKIQNQIKGEGTSFGNITVLPNDGRNTLQNASLLV